MGPTFIGNMRGDMAWLRKTLIPNMPLNYWRGSAVVYGNLDCPWRVDLYESPKPSIYDCPAVYVLKPNGKLARPCGVLYKAYRIQWKERATWEARYNDKYHLTPAISGRNKWSVDYSIFRKDDFGAYAIGLHFIVKGHRAKSKEWLHKRTTRVKRLAELLNKIELY